MNAKLLNITLALLIYLPTCIFIPLNLYFVLFALTIYLNRDFLKDYFSNLLRFKILDKNFTLILLFSFIAFAFRIIDSGQWESIKDIYSFAYLFPFTYIIAKSLNGRAGVFKYLIYFIAIEVIVSIIEYALGVTTIFTFFKHYREFDNYNLLYFTRTFGLSGNSSLLSFKHIFGLILLSTVNFSKTKEMAIELLLLVGAVITFGRIALVVVFFYLLLRLIDSAFVKKDFKIIRQLPFILLILFFSVNPKWSYNQFTRNETKVTESKLSTDELGGNGMTKNETIELTKELGLSKVDMSGRNEIWNIFLTFSLNNPQMGNKGKKLMFGRYHAHNSFIELWASFGLYMFLFMMFIILRKIRVNNYVFILTLGLLSMGQYLVFWGVSMFDIIFYYLLFFYKKDEDK